MADTYRIMRTWRDGEPMRVHPVTDETGTPVKFADADAAIRYAAVQGGWVERDSDGAVWVGCGDGWVDADTGVVK
jgi:hypothetical protein